MATYAVTATTFAIQQLYWGGSGAGIGTSGAIDYGAPPSPTSFPEPPDLPTTPEIVNPSWTELAEAVSFTTYQGAVSLSATATLSAAGTASSPGTAVTLTPGTAVQSTTSVTTITPTLPSGLVSGDYVLVV